MKISFIVPSYNNLRYLKNAYHSIRTWEDEDHEIVDELESDAEE